DDEVGVLPGRVVLQRAGLPAPRDHPPAGAVPDRAHADPAAGVERGAAGLPVTGQPVAVSAGDQPGGQLLARGGPAGLRAPLPPPPRGNPPDPPPPPPRRGPAPPPPP